MKRFAVLIAMLMPLSLFVSGCGGAGKGPESKTEEEKKAKQKEFMEFQQKQGKVLSKNKGKS